MVARGENDAAGIGVEPNALDAWIRRELRGRYGAVAREAVPEDLLELLDDKPRH